MDIEKQEIYISKFLSLILRHKPETIGIELDNNGWTDVSLLIEKANNYGVELDIELLKYVVENNVKNRFSFSESFSRIRANQGHSVDIELGIENSKPPEILYHGTSASAIQSIFNTGLHRKSRQYVHLSSDIDTALKVGQRKGKPIVINVLAEQMYLDNFEFFISQNGVWLTKDVPIKYLTLNSKLNIS